MEVSQKSKDRNLFEYFAKNKLSVALKAKMNWIKTNKNDAGIEFKRFLKRDT